MTSTATPSRATGACTMAMGQIRQATPLLRAALRVADPEWVSTATATEMPSLLGALEKLSVAAAVRYAQRSRKDAPGLLATVAGSADVLVRVDAATLVRGEVRDGECCEIAGIGPVPVDHARQLIGECFFTLLVPDGVDIRTVTSTTRTVPTRVAKALLLRDLNCVVPGCGATEHLKIDHWRIDFARGGPTQLDNLCRLCTPAPSLEDQDTVAFDGRSGPVEVASPSPGGAWAMGRVRACPRWS